MAAYKHLKTRWLIAGLAMGLVLGCQHQDDDDSNEMAEAELGDDAVVSVPAVEPAQSPTTQDSTQNEGQAALDLLASLTPTLAPATPAAVQSFINAVGSAFGPPAACPQLALSSQQGQTGMDVMVTGLPAGMTNVGIRVWEDGLPASPHFLNQPVEQGASRFSVPVMPSLSSQGGEVMLEFGDANQSCPKVSFTIQPLPGVQTDYAITIFNKLEAWVDQNLRVLGYDPDQLLSADPNTLPEQDLAWWLVKQYTSGDVDGSLKRLVAAENANAQLFVEQVLKVSGIESELDDALSALASTPILPFALPSNAQPALANNMPASYDITGKALKNCQGLGFRVRTAPIQSAQELSSRLLSARKALLFDGSLSGRVLGAAGLADIHNTGTAAGVLGAIVYVAKTVNEARRAMEPHAVDRFEADTETLWVEDRPAALPLHYKSAKVWAKGLPFNLAKATLEGVITAVGMVPGPVGSAVTAAGVIAPNQVNAAIDGLTKGSCFRLEPAEYGPVSVVDEPWTHTRIEGSAFERLGHREYVARDIGSAEWIVSLDSPAFGFTGVVEKRFTLQSQPLIISLLSDPTIIGKPGDTVVVSATAQNAWSSNKAKFTAEVLGGLAANDNGVILSQQEDGGFYDVEVKTTTERDRFPIFVRFTSLYPTLPANAPARTVDATIKTGGSISINPSLSCLLPGAQVDLTADVQGFQPGNDGVNWQATDGSFSNIQAQSATFTAPNSLGAGQITATAQADSNVSESIEFVVSNDCMKKAWVPNIFAEVPGNGTYSDCSTIPAQHDASQLFEVAGDIPDFPSLPTDSQFWFDKVDDMSVNFAHISTHFGSDTSGCSSLQLSSSNTSQVNYQGLPDGTLSVSMNGDLHATCGRHADNEIACADSSLSTGINGYYALSLSKETTLSLRGELQCNGLQGNITLMPITVAYSRYRGGNVLAVDGITDANGQGVPPNLITVDCQQANQTFSFDKSFILAAPTGNTDDLIILNIFGSWAMLANGMTKSDFSQTTFPQQGGPGRYETQGELIFTIKAEAL